MEHHILGWSRKKKAIREAEFIDFMYHCYHGLVKHDTSIFKDGISNKKLVNDILCNIYEILCNHQDKPKFIPNSANFLEIFANSVLT